MSIIKYEIILDLFLNKLIPDTKISVSKGNKIFGAFIIKKEDLSFTISGANNETENPLFHGEISTIINFFKSKNLNPKEYFFISSHEPCSMCLSAITWCGFDNFYFFFPYLICLLPLRVISIYNIFCKIIVINQKKHQFNFFVNMYVDKLLRIILMVYLNSLLYLIGTHVTK